MKDNNKKAATREIRQTIVRLAKLAKRIEKLPEPVERDDYLYVFVRAADTAEESRYIEEAVGKAEQGGS